MAEENDDLGLGFEMKDEYKPKPTESSEENEQKEETPANEKPEEEEEKQEEKIEETPANEKPEEEEEKQEEEEKEEEEEPEAQEEEEEEKPEQPESSLKDISELTEGNFKTPDELYEAYKAQNQKMEGKSVIQLIDEKVAEEYGEGTTYSDLVNFKSIDLEEMGNLELIERSLKFNDPDITDEQLEAELFDFEIMKLPQSQIDKMIEDDKISEREVSAIKARMISRARVAKNELKEAQDTIDLDGLEITVPSTNVKEQQKSPEEVKAELDAYSKDIHNFEGFEVEVGTKDNPHSMKIDVSDEDRNGMQEFLFPGEDGKNWIDRRWVGEDGKINMQQLLMDVHKIKNYERDMKLAFTQGGNAKVKQEVKDIDNINLESKQGGGSTKHESKDIHADIANRIN